jgi:16S rRNA processing protein RimM
VAESASPPAGGPPPYLAVARVLRPHGVRGDLRVQALTRFPERMYRLEQVFLGPAPDDYTALRPHTVRRVRPEKDEFWLLHLEGIDDRDEAEPLRGQFIFVALADAVPLAEDEVYVFQIMGLEVRTLDDFVLGRVVDVIETGANDVYVIQGEAYGEVLLPAIEGVIVRIDVEGGLMTVNPLPGLLPD